MKFKKYFRNGKINTGLEVTKSELLELANLNMFISISAADQNKLKQLNDFDIVGAIFGDVYNLSGVSDSWAKMNNADKIVENPDCWFVFKPENHGYKDLEKSKFKFGEAIDLLKLGYKVRRECWNDNMFLIYVPGSRVTVKENTPYYKAGLRDEIQIESHIDIFMGDGKIQPGWTASQADMLAEDWIIVKQN